MIVIGFASENSGFEEGYSFATIDDTTDEDGRDSITQKMSFLKTATTITYLKNRPVTEENLLAVLGEIQRVTENKFSKGMKEVRAITSCAIDKQACEWGSFKVICQSPKLSLPGPGRRFLVIDPQLMPSDVVEIDKAWFHYLLDLAAASYAIEDTKPGKMAQSAWAIRKQVLESAGFGEGRQAIAARMAAM